MIVVDEKRGGWNRGNWQMTCAGRVFALVIYSWFRKLGELTLWVAKRTGQAFVICLPRSNETVGAWIQFWVSVLSASPVSELFVFSAGFQLRVP